MNRSEYWKHHGHPKLDLMEESISGEPVVTKEQADARRRAKRLRAAIMEWIKRMVKK